VFCRPTCQNTNPGGAFATVAPVVVGARRAVTPFRKDDDHGVFGGGVGRARRLRALLRGRAGGSGDSIPA
jgi:hypothetical protein